MKSNKESILIDCWDKASGYGRGRRYTTKKGEHVIVRFRGKNNEPYIWAKANDVTYSKSQCAWVKNNY